VNAYEVKAVWCVCSVKAVWSIPERFRSDAFHLRRYTNGISLPLPFLPWWLVNSLRNCDIMTFWSVRVPKFFFAQPMLEWDFEIRCGWSGGQRLTPGRSGASMTSRPPGSMLAVTVCGSTASGRSNSLLNSRQLVRPGVFSSCRAWTISLRSIVFTVRSRGSNSAPISTAMRNSYQQPF